MKILYAWLVDPKDIEIFRKAQIIQMEMFPCWNAQCLAFSSVNGLLPTIMTVNIGQPTFTREAAEAYARDYALKYCIDYIMLLDANTIVANSIVPDVFGRVGAYTAKELAISGKADVYEKFQYRVLKKGGEDLKTSKLGMFRPTVLDLSCAEQSDMLLLSVITLPTISISPPVETKSKPTIIIKRKQ